MKTIENIIYPAIPLDAGQIPGWKHIPIKDGNFDPLIPLGPLSPEANILMTSSIYFGEHSNSPYAKHKNKLEGSLLTLFARQSVAHRLVVAERLLPAGHHLLLFDAYRPLRVQESLHDFYKQKLRERHPNMNEEVLDSETQKYVSLPSTDPTRPSPHNTGGVVDVAIIRFDQVREQALLQVRSRLNDSNLDFAKRVGLEVRLSAIMRRYGKMLDFGTAFDHGGEKSALTYYESKIAAGEILTDRDRRACNNRRLLFSVMTRAGFQPYFAEWWHFDAPETQWGAAAAGVAYATLGAIKLNESNKAHENTRLRIRQDILKLYREGDRAAPQTTLEAETLAVLRWSGDPTLANDWPAEIIAPEE